MDILRFQTACDHVLQLQQKGTLIGTLSEKTTHAILTYYIEPDASCHEIRVGSFYITSDPGKRSLPHSFPALCIGCCAGMAPFPRIQRQPAKQR